MSDWKRRTQQVSFEDLLPEMINAVQKHIEHYNLGPILSDALICIQTDSEKTKKSLFSGAETVYTGAVVLPRWLIWVTNGTKRNTTVLSALLKDIVVQDYAQTSFAKTIPDSGINVSGKFTDMSESVTAFIGLEDNPAGNKFKEIVIQAVQDAKR
jgi:hypothetical protein